MCQHHWNMQSNDIVLIKIAFLDQENNDTIDLHLSKTVFQPSSIENILRVLLGGDSFLVYKIDEN